MNTTENCWKNLMKDTISKYLNEGEKAAPVLGFDDYYITSTGRVFSSKTKFEYQTLDKVNYGCIAWKELKPTIVRGYKTVNLSNRNVRKKFYIHELVWITFMGDYVKHYFKIKHINKNKLDNRLNNLALEFRKKDKKFIDKYVYQSKLLRCFNE